MHVNTAVFLDHVYLYKRHGIAPEALIGYLEQYGFDRKSAQTDWIVLARSWDYLMAHLPPRFDYVKAYCELTPDYLGTLGELIRVSDTSYDALQHFIAFNLLVNSFIHFDLAEDGQEVVLEMRLPDIACELFPESYKIPIIAAFCAWTNTISLLSLRTIAPLRMTFSFFDRDPENTFYHRLKCQPVFNAPKNTIVFRKADLYRPLESRNSRLFKKVYTIVGQQRQDLDGSRFHRTVEQKIYRALPFRLPEMEDVCASLQLSARTVQRRLKTEGQTFKAVSDRVLLRLALELLQRKELSVRDIACFLGFSSASAFTTTFTRWTGNTPMAVRMEYRRRSSD